eukprot:CAMPEP_0194287788 /NCGR_PEP_ID=MMETSP0169-20130528/35483_1 /TAXON_ID=218684 /ORGANISM="Corethron pennatum, Strain L29A3" /LENGTH=334 /DNA_ID=CAMNT_0039034599 /DNA_START=12 /DNA_END=1016 /DNA_ORIENTATION=+
MIHSKNSSCTAFASLVLLLFGAPSSAAEYGNPLAASQIESVFDDAMFSNLRKRKSKQNIGAPSSAAEYPKPFVASKTESVFDDMIFSNLRKRKSKQNSRNRITTISIDLLEKERSSLESDREEKERSSLESEIFSSSYSYSYSYLATGRLRTKSSAPLDNSKVICSLSSDIITKELVVDFVYHVRTMSEATTDVFAKLEQAIFDSVASKIVDCSKELPDIHSSHEIVARRNLEGNLVTGAYKKAAIVETCNGDKKCIIVHSGITVAYAADKEAALIYTINTIKEKMDNGEFDNEDDAISVKYGTPGNHLKHNDLSSNAEEEIRGYINTGITAIS